ncbi:MAG TPA: hypothetical protein VLE43_18135, partial [Candidatus Saccharimonadia bacterium]|nr:hypothetical protein [Candidatus Saccharimonadia bacterium]
KFFGTALVLGLAMASNWIEALITPAIITAVLKLAWEGRYLSLEQAEHRRAQLLLLGPLKWWHVTRFMVGMLGAVLMLHSAWLGFTCLLMGEFLERALFFRAAAAWRMPGHA